MRISDWSSDVCSSDLLGLHLHRGLQAVERVPPTLLCVAVHLVAADRGGVLLGIQARELPIQIRHVVGQAPGLGDQPLGRRQIGAPLRSEEHTSELQSLIRTSYAVFCLNKK